MNSGKLVCTICPRGCQLTWRKQVEEIEIEGHQCPRGKAYGLSELKNPVRTLTTTVKVLGGQHALVPVRSVQPIPKGYLHKAMKDLARISLPAPIEAGSVVLADWQGLEVDFIATRSIIKKP